MSQFEYESEEQREVFEHLDGLRESGANHMTAAAPWLAWAFNMGLPQARLYLSQWMETFSERHKSQEKGA